MAFLQQAPRRAVPPQRDNEERLDASIRKGKGKSAQQNTSQELARDSSASSGDKRDSLKDDNKDWSIVFPGRPSRSAPLEPATQAISATAAVSQGQDRSFVADAAQSPTPFLDEEEFEEEHIDTSAAASLTLPPLHDGTGRFAGQSSPDDFADDEAERSPSSPEVFRRRTSRSPIASLRAPLTDSVTIDSLSMGEDLSLDDDGPSISSSIELFSETESEAQQRRQRRSRRRSSVLSARHATHGAPLDGRHLRVPASSMRPGSASWAWMHAPQHQSRLRRTGSQLSVVLTSDSEAEEAEVEREVAASTSATGGVFDSAHLIEYDDAAFEEALANTHWAHSAGLRSRVGRVPKRRHRRAGESEKGSKRSNNSAAVASDLRSPLAGLSATSAALRERRQTFSARRSAVSGASARARLRTHQHQKQRASEQGQADIDGVLNEDAGVKQSNSPRKHRFMSTILRRVFGVDDDEILAAFLENEGPLRIEPTKGASASSTAALFASQRGQLGERAEADDVWRRTQRNRQMRLLMSAEANGVAVDSDDEQEELSSLSVLGKDGNAGLGSGHRPADRTHVSSNVAEPSLVEALQASVLSGLRVLPSGLSMLMAGSHSVRLVNYLVARIGPQFSDRIRKLLDDDEVATAEAELEAALHDGQLGSAPQSATTRARSGTLASSSGASRTSSTRFSGAAHPALTASASRSP